VTPSAQFCPRCRRTSHAPRTPTEYWFWRRGSRIIPNTITEVPAVQGLSALEIDPEQAAEAYRERIIGPVRALLPAKDVRSIEEQLSGSCTTEIASFNEFTALLTDGGTTGQFDHVLFDTAPTGHTIRLLQPGPETASDPQVLELTAPLRAAADTYLNTMATTLGADLDGRWARMEDTALMHLLHTVARQASGAQITALASPGPRIFIPRGLTSVRQFYALCPDDARICRIRVSGRQLRAYLEHAARFYNFSHNPELYNRAVDPRDFDTLDGCAYVLDISRPAGTRVVDLKVQGKPVKDDQTFTLGLLSSRLAGIGGYLEAMGWSGLPEFQSPAPFRNLLLEYVLSRPSLAPAADDHWRIVPALDRERVLAQQP